MNDEISINVSSLKDTVNNLTLATFANSNLYNSFPLSLEDRCIRLLVIDPLPLTTDDTSEEPLLTGTIRIESLKTCPDFCALSYVWGGYSTPRDTISIRLDSGQIIQLDLTTNCRDALRAIRRQHRANPIWVDAICINQTDLKERSEQILLMDEIYSWAETVYVWLGMGTTASDRAFQVLSQLSRQAVFLDVVACSSAASAKERRKAVAKLALALLRNSGDRAWRRQKALTQLWLRLYRAPKLLLEFCWLIAKSFSTPHNYQLDERQTDRHMDDMLTPLDFLLPYQLSTLLVPQVIHSSVVSVVQDIEEVAARPWFQRGWTFQEIVLASNISVLCGSSTLSWDVLIRGLAKLNQQYKFETANVPAVLKLIDLINTWNQIERPTAWHTKRRRRALPMIASIAAYQEDVYVWLNRHFYLTVVPGLLSLAFLAGLHIFANILLFESILGIGIAFSQAQLQDAQPTSGCNNDMALSNGTCSDPVSNYYRLNTIPEEMRYFFQTISIVAAVIAVVAEIWDIIMQLMFCWNQRGMLDLILVILLPILGLFFNVAEVDSLTKYFGVMGFGVKFKENSRTQQSDPSLPSVIQAIRERQTGDPRDRSFAAYAVLVRIGMTPSPPDYTKLHGIVYLELFKELVQWRPKLLNLMLDLNGVSLPGTPSWVPNWEAAADLDWVGVPTSRQLLSVKNTKIEAIFNGGRLRVKGVSLGGATFCLGVLGGFNIESAQDLNHESFQAEDQISWLQAAHRLAKWVRCIITHVTMKYDESIPELVANVLSFGKFRKKRSLRTARRSTAPPPSRNDSNNHNLANLDNHSFDLWYAKISTVSPALLERDQELDKPVGEVWDGFYKHMIDRHQSDLTNNAIVKNQTMHFSNCLAGRRVFVTSLGYVGCGLETMEINDVVCLIAGVAAPMILRPVHLEDGDTNFRVIGPAFVPGQMKKELTEEPNLVTFDLV